MPMPPLGQKGREAVPEGNLVPERTVQHHGAKCGRILPRSLDGPRPRVKGRGALGLETERGAHLHGEARAHPLPNPSPVRITPH